MQNIENVTVQGCGAGQRSHGEPTWLPLGCIGKPSWLDTEAAWVDAKGWAMGRREGPGELGSPLPPRSQRPLGSSGPKEAAPGCSCFRPLGPCSRVQGRWESTPKPCPSPPWAPVPGTPRAFPCLQMQPARLSTAFLTCPASLLPARAPPAPCTGRGQAAMRFPSLVPRCRGSLAVPLPTPRRSWFPVQHSPLSHCWVFVSVCLLSLCPAGLLSRSLLDPTTASPRGREGNRCSVKCLLGD